MGWFIAAVLCQDGDPSLLHERLEEPRRLGDWSPLRSFDVAARAFFSAGDLRAVPFEAPPVSRPTPGALSEFGVGARLQLWDADAQGFDFALAAFDKIPFGRDPEPATEVALAALARIPVGRSSFNLHVGATVPFGQEDLLDRAKDVELASFAFAGAGFAWQVTDTVTLGFQLEANTSAFKDADLLRRHPASAVAGLHAVWGDLVLEAGLGTGFDRIAGYPWMAYVSVSIVF